MQYVCCSITNGTKSYSHYLVHTYIWRLIWRRLFFAVHVFLCHTILCSKICTDLHRSLYSTMEDEERGQREIAHTSEPKFPFSKKISSQTYAEPGYLELGGANESPDRKASRTACNPTITVRWCATSMRRPQNGLCNTRWWCTIASRKARFSKSMTRLNACAPLLV